MKNRIFSFLLAALMLITLAACNKDDENEGSAGTYDPQAEGSSAAGEDDPDAWWQQYTTEPEQPVAKPQDKPADKTTNPKQNKPGTTNPKTNGKTPTKPSNNTQPTAAPELYTKVDSNTMKYPVKGEGTTGVVTLTKAGSNTCIKQTLEAANASFGTKLTAANTMCFSSTLPSMKNTNLVFVFSGSKKSKDTLLCVTSFSNNTIEAFGEMSVDSEKVPMYFWPCKNSDTENYNAYLATFKQGMDAATYTQYTNTFKSLLDDECVKQFLSW